MVAREQTQVIGIRLPKQTVVAFKREAVSRNARLNELFQEMWELYQQAKREDQKKKSNGS